MVCLLKKAKFLLQLRELISFLPNAGFLFLFAETAGDHHHNHRRLRSELDEL